MYPEEVIAQFKAGMNKKEKEKPKEKVKEASAAKGLFAFDLFPEEMASRDFSRSLTESSVIEFL